MAGDVWVPAGAPNTAEAFRDSSLAGGVLRGPTVPRPTNHPVGGQILEACRWDHSPNSPGTGSPSMQGPVPWLLPWVSPIYTGSQLLKGRSGQRGPHHPRPLCASLDPSLSGSLGEAGPILNSEKDRGSGLPGAPAAR